MTETLSDFLVRKAREIDVETAGLYDRIEALENERALIDKAAAAAGVTLGHASGSKDAGGEGEQPHEEEVRAFDATASAMRSAKRAPEVTIKEAVIAILADAGHGMTALEILPAVNARLGIDYPRTSLSPQLSRLKNDGKIERNGHEWSLAPETNKAPDAGTSEASEVPGSNSEEIGKELI